MKKLLIIFNTLSVFPTLGQLAIAYQFDKQKEFSKININDVNEIQLKEWILTWNKNVEEKSIDILTTDEIKETILSTLGLLAVAYFIDEEEKFKTTVQQMKSLSNVEYNVDTVFKLLQKISEEKLVKASMLVFLILYKESGAFKWKFDEKALNQKNRQFVLTVEKTNWDDIKEKTNQAFIETKKFIVDNPIDATLNIIPNNLKDKILKDENLKDKVLKMQALIKHITFEDVKNVHDSITNVKKTFTVDFIAK